ncbi:Rpc53p [Sugiyamaella lignohabitans]|uniref:Rpc53p n=1 Tax=Sugiyamaella lignohabitans TaxID=796027 RepID=A0A167EJD9_9ASCO|nr:Rpc53p [Sugiyamaella lignohabitans]ANB14151.1 Rpc53p [Sugiyamaella lignohabitans]
MPPGVPKSGSGDGTAGNGAGASSNGETPRRLQSLSQRSGAGLARGGGATGARARFAPKAVARRTKEERDSTAPQEKIEVKPAVSTSSSSRGGGRGGAGPGGRGGISGRGRGRGRFEPVVSAAVGPLAAPSGVDPRGSRFSSPAVGIGAYGGGSGGSRPSAFGSELASMVARVKSETPGVSSGYSSRASSVEVEEDRIDMTENSYVDGALSEYFPVRLDRRREDDEDEEEEEDDEDEENEQTGSGSIKHEDEVDSEGNFQPKVKSEPTDDYTEAAKLLAAKKNKKKSSNSDNKAKRSEAAIFQEEQLRELRRMTHDHKVIAKEFNMDGKQKSTSPTGEDSELDGLEEIEKRLYFFQFPIVMPQLIPRETHDNRPNEKTEPSPEEEEDDDLIVVDEKLKTPPSTATTTTASMKPSVEPETANSSSSVIEGDLPEGLIGKLRLHRSGKLTMVVGNITMDVSQGTECSFLQDVVVMDPDDKNAYLIGQVSKKMVLSPELDDESLL